MLEYRRSKVISLKGHAEYNERWLQDRIAADPELLGLGELSVRDVERRQPRAGRLDLLLVDDESRTRYEVEIQLGATDESHIIRTLEYWDIERRRYPQYDHVAVIVAEDVTSRFLNVKSTTPARAERAAVRELVKAARERGEELTGPDGLLKSITKQVLEAALEEEMTEHVGYDKHAVAAVTAATPVMAAGPRRC